MLAACVRRRTGEYGGVRSAVAKGSGALMGGISKYKPANMTPMLPAKAASCTGQRRASQSWQARALYSGQRCGDAPATPPGRRTPESRARPPLSPAQCKTPAHRRRKKPIWWRTGCCNLTAHRKRAPASATCLQHGDDVEGVVLTERRVEAVQPEAHRHDKVAQHLTKERSTRRGRQALQPAAMCACGDADLPRPRGSCEFGAARRTAYVNHSTQMTVPCFSHTSMSSEKHLSHELKRRVRRSASEGGSASCGRPRSGMVAEIRDGGPGGPRFEGLQWLP